MSANDDLLAALTAVFDLAPEPETGHAQLNYVGKRVLPTPSARMFSVDVKVKQDEAVRFNYRRDDGLLLVLFQGPWPLDKARLPYGLEDAPPQWLSVQIPDFGDTLLYLHATNVLAVEAP